MDSQDHLNGKIARSLINHDLDNLVFGKRSHNKLNNNVPSKVMPLKKHIIVKNNTKKKKTFIKSIQKKQQPILPKQIDKRIKKEKIMQIGIIYQKNIQQQQQQLQIKQNMKKLKQQSLQKIENSLTIEKQGNYLNKQEKLEKSQKCIKKLKIQCQEQELQNKNQNQKVNINTNTNQRQNYERQLGTRTRTRPAKEGIIINYIEENDHYTNSQSSDQVFKVKKTNVKSNSKQNNINYNLNRIFRKNKRLDLPIISLKVDLLQVSFHSLIQELGNFDMIHCSVPLGNMTEKGFIFIWCEYGEIQMGYHWLNRWGYDVIDQIMWIKCNEGKKKIYNSIPSQQTHSIFLNCKSTCLVGYKCPIGQKADYKTKISNNIIFSQPEEGIHKPKQIYEIAELMMAGSKKLQIGSNAPGGWFNLQHIEQTLWRCRLCLRSSKKLILLNNQFGQTICQQCLNLRQQSNDQNNSQKILKTIISGYKIFSSQQIEFNYSKCCKCNSKYTNIGLISCQIEDKSLILCQSCFIVMQNQFNHCISKIQVIYKSRKFYNSVKINCSKCSKCTLIGYYFQCNSCKNHVICQECFWHLKNQKEHEWKIKKITNVPEIKIICFGCKEECIIPYWCCEVCQNWYWCGHCDKGAHPIHPHYQSYHPIYLMI